MLRYVATTCLAASVRDLCDDVVYRTEPMLEAELGKPLQIDRVNRVADDALSFNLERMLAGEASEAAGRTRPWTDLMGELRARCQ